MPQLDWWCLPASSIRRTICAKKKGESYWIYCVCTLVDGLNIEAPVRWRINKGKRLGDWITKTLKNKHGWGEKNATNLVSEHAFFCLVSAISRDLNYDNGCIHFNSGHSKISINYGVKWQGITLFSSRLETSVSLLWEYGYREIENQNDGILWMVDIILR